jgi:hypothetical protein
MPLPQKPKLVQAERSEGSRDAIKSSISQPPARTQHDVAVSPELDNVSFKEMDAQYRVLEQQLAP